MKKGFLTFIGCIALGIGILGIVLPLLPTTPLLLLAATCFFRSSEKLYQWLMNNKWFGPYIKNFRAGKGIPLRAKVIGVSLLWLSMGYTIFYVIPLFIIKMLLIVTACIFTIVILKQKTLHNSR